MKKRDIFFTSVLTLTLAAGGFYGYQRFMLQEAVLKKIISRLEAESRVAEVLVTDVVFDEEKRAELTTIKFLEFDSAGRPLTPRYFTFTGNLIQFQSLVVRFDDDYIRKGDMFKGKSVFLFWKVFRLDGPKTEEYTITPLQNIPAGYKLMNPETPWEQQFWQDFWVYALEQDKAQTMGVKNAQVEAPGTKFVPGYLYTIKIEHDGGLRIDAARLPSILKGEKILE